MDLRKIGEPLEKKYIQFSKENIEKIIYTYHHWQQENSQYQERITDLSSKLKITENNLAKALESPKGKDSIAQAALIENKALRSIVKRKLWFISLFSISRRALKWKIFK